MSKEIEQSYQHLITQFIQSDIDADAFEKQYDALWCKHRDNGAFDGLDVRFQRLIDHLFTSCDVYEPDAQPNDPYTISAEQLKQEVELLAYVWWGICPPKINPQPQ